MATSPCVPPRGPETAPAKGSARCAWPGGSRPPSARLLSNEGAVLLLLSDAREACLTAAKARDLSPRTVTWCALVVGQFAAHAGAAREAARSRPTTAAFLTARLDGHRARRVENHRTALRVFFRWLVAEESVDRDPTLREKGPRVPRHVPVVLSSEEAGALLRAWPGSGYVAPRNRANVLTLLDTGLVGGGTVLAHSRQHGPCSWHGGGHGQGPQGASMSRVSRPPRPRRTRRQLSLKVEAKRKSSLAIGQQVP